MRLLATLQLCCACLAAFWAAGLQALDERSVSLPYFTQEPTELLVDETADVLRRGSSNVYYFTSPSDLSAKLLTLRCLATTPDAATKFLKYFWTVNGVEIPEWRDKTTVVLIGADFHSRLSNYRCVASLLDSATGKTRNISSSQLTLIPGPSYPMNSNRPSSQTKIKCNANSQLTINSSCYMSPVPYIHWNDVDSFIQSGDAYTSSTGSLIIRCNAVTKTLVVSVNCFNSLLRFVGGDVYTVLPDNSNVSMQRITQLTPKQHLTFTVGDSVYFACRSALSVPNPVVKFFRNYPASAVEIGVNRRYLTFIQMNVTLEDAGQYYCEVTSNGTATKFYDEMELTVLAPPFWIRKPPTVEYVIAGDSLSLEYEVGGSPIPDKLEYRLRGDLTDNSTGSAFTTRSYKDTRVHRRGDSYALELSFANNQGELFTSVAVIVIKPMTKPILSFTPILDKSSGGNLLTMQCSTEFDTLLERPEVKWEFPFDSSLAQDWYSSSTAPIAITNGELKSHRSIKLDGNESFTPDEIFRASTKIFGNYTCTFFSPFYGNISTTHYVDISTFYQPTTAEVVVVKYEYTWWIVAIVVLFLLIMLLVLAIFCWRNTRGRSYNVDEKERRQGNDPLVEMRKEGFADYRRPDQDPQRIARDDLEAGVSMNESLDGSELDGYGDENADKFNEDGSFIGLYSTNQRAAAAQPQNAAAVRSSHAQSNLPYAYSTMAPGISANKRQQANSPRLVAHSGSGARTLPHPNNINRPQVIPTQVDTTTTTSPRVYSAVVAPRANLPDSVQANDNNSYAPLTPPHSESNMRDSHLQLDGSAGQLRGPARFGVATPLAGVISHNNTLV